MSRLKIDFLLFFFHARLNYEKCVRASDRPIPNELSIEFSDLRYGMMSFLLGKCLDKAFRVETAGQESRGRKYKNLEAVTTCSGLDNDFAAQFPAEDDEALKGQRNARANPFQISFS